MLRLIVRRKGLRMHISIGEAALLIGVADSTLRRWEKEGSFHPCFRTKGSHRRYSLTAIKREFHKKTEATSPRKTIGYARVSSHDQKKDLERQIQRLSNYCQAKGYSYALISDLGSGLNFEKKGLVKVIHQICLGQVERLILTHRDRLLRFGAPLLFKICSYFDTEVVVLEEMKELSFEEELVSDVVELMTVFTSRLYGKRSGKNRRSISKVA